MHVHIDAPRPAVVLPHCLDDVSNDLLGLAASHVWPTPQLDRHAPRAAPYLDAHTHRVGAHALQVVTHDPVRHRRVGTKRPGRHRFHRRDRIGFGGDRSGKTYQWVRQLDVNQHQRHPARDGARSAITRPPQRPRTANAQHHVHRGPLQRTRPLVEDRTPWSLTQPLARLHLVTAPSELAGKPASGSDRGVGDEHVHRFRVVRSRSRDKGQRSFAARTRTAQIEARPCQSTASSATLTLA